MHTNWAVALVAVAVLLPACGKSDTPAGKTEGRGAGTTETSGGPKVAASGSVTDGAAIDGLPGLVQDMQADFRRCYASALEKDPKLAGSVRVTVELGSSGAIGALSTAASKGIGKDLGSCIDLRVRRAKFNAPKGPRSTVMITVELSP